MISGRTLKQKPVIGKVNTSLGDDGAYELSVDEESDPDNSIRKYVYTITSETGAVIKTLESAAGPVKWYFGSKLALGVYFGEK